MRRGAAVLVVAGLLGVVALSGVAQGGGGASAQTQALQLDCVYRDGQNDSCAQLEADGFSADTNYGLGNSLTQAPNDALRTDCIDKNARLSCAELGARVAGAVADPTSDQGLTCAFFEFVATEAFTFDELIALERLVGPDAPPGVGAGLGFFETGDGDVAAALASIDGYLYPVCTTEVRRASLVIRSDTAIGGFKTKVPTGGTLATAYAALGAPSDIRRDADGCTVLWALPGLQMSFANLGGDDACAPKTGFFVHAQMKREPWKTDKGLRIGDSLSRLQRKYPKATQGDQRGSQTEWRLIVRREPAGFGGGKVPRLLALVDHGRVVAFELTQSNAGE